MTYEKGLRLLLVMLVLAFGMGTIFAQGQERAAVVDQSSSQAAAVGWETRQAYELTHLHTWRDFRPSVLRAIAGYEAHERGITEVVNVPGEPTVAEGGYYKEPVLITVDEANEIIRTIVSHRYEHTEDGVTTYWLPWEENGSGYGDGWSGTSATHHAGLGLAYALAKYPHLIPDDLERDLNETVGRLDWFGNYELHPYMSYSNIPLAGACGMLLAGDYVEPDPARGLTQAYIDNLKVEGYAWFDRMFEEVKQFGYYEITSSYTSVQHVSLPTVYEMAKDPAARQKARFLLDELYLHLAHLYQPGETNGTSYEPGANLAGFHDRSYSDAVKGRPNGHVMWLITGDPGGELMVDWWPYTTLVASGYRPPEFITGIALKEAGVDYQVDQTFWSDGSATTLAFEPDLPDMPEWSGTSSGRQKLVPHHTYMLADGSLALGGTSAHIHSSRTGSHNLRLSFSKTGLPLAVTHVDPEKAGSEPEYPLEFAFELEQPSFRRLFSDNIVLSVWDPMAEGFNYTNAFIPIDGVERVEHRGRWFFIKQDGAFMAYAVLADPQHAVSIETRDGFAKGSARYSGSFYYVRTPDGALAAGVGEIGSASDYASFEAFMADIEGRTLSFNSSTGRLSYRARNGETLAVDYDSDRYEIDGGVKQRADFAPEYFIKSPWAEHRIPTSSSDDFITEVNWNGTTWRYDWKTLEVTTFGTLGNDVSPAQANRGDTVSYTLRVRGNGERIALSDFLPSGLSPPVSMTATEGHLNYDGSVHCVDWEGSPANGTVVEIEISTQVTTDETKMLVNTAELAYAPDLVTTATSTLMVNSSAIYLPLVIGGG